MLVWLVFAPLSTMKILLIYQLYHTIYVLLCIYDTCVVNVHVLCIIVHVLCRHV